MKNIIGKILGKPSAAAQYGGMAMQMLMQNAGYLPVAQRTPLPPRRDNADGRSHHAGHAHQLPQIIQRTAAP